eukprot:SAG25_NODE_10520_length_330_cov_1.779221_1_plen_27_part_01
MRPGRWGPGERHTAKQVSLKRLLAESP